MTKAGRSFESALMDSLEEWVGDHGTVIFFAQSKATRGSQFLMSQPCDMIVDAAETDYRIGVEAKSVDVTTSSAKYGMYFSHRYKPKQIRKQVDYQRKAGRPILVAIELRNYEPQEGSQGDYAYLLPVDDVAHLLESGEKRLTYDWVEEHGVPIGEDGDYAITSKAVREVAS